MVITSVASGLSATALICPTDMIKTRMMNQVMGKEEYRTVYRSSHDYLVNIVKSENVHALWKCFIPVRPLVIKQNYSVQPLTTKQIIFNISLLYIYIYLSYI